MASFNSYDISAVQEFVPTGGEAPPFAHQPEQPAMALPTQLLLTPPAEALLEGPDFLFAPSLDPFLPSSMGYYFGPSRRGASGALGLPRYYARVTSLGLPLPPVLVNLALPPDALQSVLANADVMLDEGYRAAERHAEDFLRVFASETDTLWERVQECYFPWLTEEDSDFPSSAFEFPRGERCAGSLLCPNMNMVLRLPYACDTESLESLEGDARAREALREKLAPYDSVLEGLRDAIEGAMAAADAYSAPLPNFGGSLGEGFDPSLYSGGEGFSGGGEGYSSGAPYPPSEYLPSGDYPYSSAAADASAAPPPARAPAPPPTPAQAAAAAPPPAPAAAAGAAASPAAPPAGAAPAPAPASAPSAALAELLAPAGPKLTRDQKSCLETLFQDPRQALPAWLPLPLPLEAPPPASQAARVLLFWSEEPIAAALNSAKITRKTDWENFARWMNSGRAQPGATKQ